MELHDFWFLAIAFLWTGYFVLEGFDFGVLALMPLIGRNQRERGVIVNTIGPHWDGNEVWVITAGGATFAAFPLWYATLFSGFYLALFAILVLLIVRNVAFEYRSKRKDPRWRRGWEIVLFLGGLLPPVLWGVAFANIVGGVPINAQGDFTGNFFTLLNPFALLGGLVFLGLFLTHGAAYLALKTTDQLRERANQSMLWVGLAAAVLAVVFLAWLEASRFGWVSATACVLAAVTLLVALGFNRLRRELLAFAATALTIVLAAAALFINLYPNVMPSTTDPAFSLTVSNAASGHLTLQIMSVVALFFLPIVLLYEGWTYWVFRKRITAPRISTADRTSAAGDVSGSGAA